MSEHVYHMDDCVLSLPPGFRDRSMHVLEWKTAGGDPLVVVIQRDELGEQSFEGYVAREIEPYPTRFAGFAPEPVAAERTTDGLELRRVRFRWHRESEVIFNSQTFLDHGKTVLVFTASGRARHKDEVEALVERMIESLRFRED